MDRLTLEQINNMTENQMREYLRGQEVENQRKDEAARIEAEEKQKRQEEAKRETEEFFREKFRAQGLNV
jgi:hypothetical protein